MPSGESTPDQPLNRGKHAYCSRSSPQTMTSKLPRARVPLARNTSSLQNTFTRFQLTIVAAIILSQSQYRATNIFAPTTYPNMSAQSLAAFRKSAGDDLANLAEQHLQHEYQLPAEHNPPILHDRQLTTPLLASPTPTAAPSPPPPAPLAPTPL
jgi:hypothetical protein